jgi:hypothetical protein
MTCVTPPIGYYANAPCDNECGCVPSSCNIPSPYAFPNPDISEECHCQTLLQQMYVAGLTVKAAFNMPGCDEETVISIAGMEALIVGMYLWNSTYGYLKVTAFDYDTGQITVMNECQDGNAEPGTTIAACTLFLPVDVPCGTAEDICSEDTETEGALVVCTDGLPSILGGDTLGYVPVLTNIVSNVVEFQDPISIFGMDPCSWDLSARVYVDRDDDDNSDSFSFNAVGNSKTVTSPEIVFENDTCVELELLIAVTLRTENTTLAIGGAGSPYLNLQVVIQYAYDEDTIGAASATVYNDVVDQTYESAFNRNASVEHDYTENYFTSYTISPGNELSFRAKAYLEVIAEAITSYAGTLVIELRCVGFAI